MFSFVLCMGKHGYIYILDAHIILEIMNIFKQIPKTKKNEVSHDARQKFRTKKNAASFQTPMIGQTRNIKQSAVTYSYDVLVRGPLINTITGTMYDDDTSLLTSRTSRQRVTSRPGFRRTQIILSLHFALEVDNISAHPPARNKGGVERGARPPGVAATATPR